MSIFEFYFSHNAFFHTYLSKELMMNEPVIAALEPAAMELEQGEHYWCSCGQSKGQPFCDGSHKGSAFSPLEFSLEKRKKVSLCMCKRTGKPPFCDGAHFKISKELP